MESAVSGASIRPSPLAGRRVLVVGLGRFGGGVGVTRWLAEQGARVTVSDAAEPSSLAPSLAAIADLDVALHLGGHDAADLDSADLAVVNPAVFKGRSPLFQEILRRGIDWTTEMNLFCERCPARVIGVTGTFGKSTTCAMLADGLRAGRECARDCYREVFLGGNIGHSLLSELAAMGSDDLVVLEMSNAQLEDLPRIRWGPAIAAVTNIWPHHLDRHGSFGAYIEAKLNLLRAPDRLQTGVIGELAPEAEEALSQLTARQPMNVVRVASPEPPLELRVPGAHNRADAAMVLTVCGAIGMEESAAREALRDYAGLPHRLQWICRFGDVDYYNDSKSTALANTLTALQSMAQPVVAIVGGQRKGVDLADWARGVAAACRAVVCTGEAGPTFARALRGAADAGGRASIVEAGSLEAAVAAARRAALPGDVVLFSPGAPSFDAHANFAERGEHFIRVVRSL